MSQPALDPGSAFSGGVIDWLSRARAFLARIRFNQLTAFLIAGLALLATLGTVSDANATERAARNNVLAVDAYAFFQAKNSRQATYEIAADEVRFLIEHSAPTSDARRALEEQLAFYEETIARYESEPDPSDPENTLQGEGKVQLLAQARYYEAEVRDARRRGASYDHTTVSAQFGIVVASGAVLLRSRRMLQLAAISGGISLAFFLNALLGVADIPFPLLPW